MGKEYISPSFSNQECNLSAFWKGVCCSNGDILYGLTYCLTRDELRYVLDPAKVQGPDYPSETFRVLKEKEIRQHGEYRTRRLVVAAWDRMEANDEFAAMGM